MYIGIISKKRLQEFIEEHPDASASLNSWYVLIKRSVFNTPKEVIEIINSADYVGNDRMVFNISGNKYRLIAKFKFHPEVQRVHIKFIGTHSQYDKISDIKNI